MDPTETEAEALAAWLDGEGDGTPPDGVDPDVLAAATTLRPGLSRPFQPDFAALRARLPPQQTAHAEAAPAETATPAVVAPSAPAVPPANNTRWLSGPLLAVAALAVVAVGGLLLQANTPDPAAPSLAQLEPAAPRTPGDESPFQPVALDPRTPLAPADGSNTDPDETAAVPAAPPEGASAEPQTPLRADGQGAVVIGRPLPVSAPEGLTGDPGARMQHDTATGHQTVTVVDGVVQSSSYRFRFVERGEGETDNAGPLPEARAQALAASLRADLPGNTAGTSTAGAPGCTASGVRQAVSVVSEPDGAWVVEARAVADPACP